MKLPSLPPPWLLPVPARAPHSTGRLGATSIGTPGPIIVTPMFM